MFIPTLIIMVVNKLHDSDFIIVAVHLGACLSRLHLLRRDTPFCSTFLPAEHNRTFRAVRQVSNKMPPSYAGCKLESLQTAWEPMARTICASLHTLSLLSDL